MNSTVHYGDFNTSFDNDVELKREFLSTLSDLFNDETCRKMVLEVDSGNNDLLSIIDDLDSVGFTYV